MVPCCGKGASSFSDVDESVLITKYLDWNGPDDKMMSATIMAGFFATDSKSKTARPSCSQIYQWPGEEFIELEFTDEFRLQNYHTKQSKSEHK